MKLLAVGGIIFGIMLFWPLIVFVGYAVAVICVIILVVGGVIGVISLIVGGVASAVDPEGWKKAVDAPPRRTPPATPVKPNVVYAPRPVEVPTATMHVDPNQTPARGTPVVPHDLSPASWYPDPAGTAQWRWWDGEQWTDHYANQV